MGLTSGTSRQLFKSAPRICNSPALMISAAFSRSFFKCLTINQMRGMPASLNTSLRRGVEKPNGDVRKSFAPRLVLVRAHSVVRNPSNGLLQRGPTFHPRPYPPGNSELDPGISRTDVFFVGFAASKKSKKSLPLRCRSRAKFFIDFAKAGAGLAETLEKSC